jgi:hypothetical protein
VLAVVKCWDAKNETVVADPLDTFYRGAISLYGSEWESGCEYCGALTIVE